MIINNEPSVTAKEHKNTTFVYNKSIKCQRSWNHFILLLTKLNVSVVVTTLIIQGDRGFYWWQQHTEAKQL